MHTAQATPYGRLYVVATPIGNLEEMTPRAVKTLSSVDIIACEDTRHTKKLCNAFHIQTPLTSYYREQEQKKSHVLLEMLVQGKDVALVSDAGTPGLSDPGAALVNKARENGISIQAVSGPSALAAAVSIAGIPEKSFFFGGFLPAKRMERRQVITSLRCFCWPLIFYESPRRIHASLTDMRDILGDREALLLRELTKIHEEGKKASLTELIEHTSSGIKGELVLIVHGAPTETGTKPDNLEELVQWYKKKQQATLKDTVQAIAGDLDLPRSKVYRNVLELWEII